MLTGTCGLLFILSLPSLFSSFLPMPLLSSDPLQSHLLTFTIIFTTAMPTSGIMAKRHAKVYAMAMLPPSVIQSVDNMSWWLLVSPATASSAITTPDVEEDEKKQLQETDTSAVNVAGAVQCPAAAPSRTRLATC
ncbi:hypothetical protein NEOLEDRAFT_1147439 [Neolentinus lepideus HHB14362 ss-1]|uniref:Uncharacterized protein n=1 Tax=Neolentinus lepideus HHB14362 ss-1 TaxID=1314782 RepID=A0A165T1L4_9AGAM|nr:hypothetical protein NEOLEDRAFT_1147439 [Neolentinus lepideus HHB14362 ss-1]